MESAALTPSSIHINKNEEWKNLKRLSERYLETDDSSLSGESEEILTDNAQSKRFKGLGNSTLEDSCFESPVNVGTMLRPKRIFQNEERFQEIHNNHHGILSPITEISMNLNETTLNSDNSILETQSVADHGFDDGTTPIKRFHNGGLPKSKLFTGSPLYNEDAKIISTKDHCMDDELGDEDFQIQRSGRNTSSRRLNLDASMSDMAMEELSFYDDDHVTQNRHFTASPQFMGLLSPEGSPQRFQVVEKSKFLQSRKNFPLTAKNIISQNVNRSTTLSTNTPSKGFRLLHSMSSTGSMESSMDDEYMEFFDMENLDQPTQSNGISFPSDLSSLISGQIIKNSPVKTPEMRRPSVRRCLSMTENTQFQPKTPEHVKDSSVSTTSTTPFNSRFNGNCCFKRPEPPSTTCSPIQSKRYRGAEKENLDGSFIAPSKTSPASSSSCSALTSASATTTRPTLRKCMSMNDAEIMSALNRSENKDEPDLIGDFSKPYVLPLIEGRHRDLKSISSHTVARLLKGDFNDKVASYKIIDCRYPYEYEGGHIEGAKNLYTQEQIIEEFLTQQKTEQEQSKNEASGNKRNIIIFHCEFSSERGPKLSRFLRNLDRERNTTAYPALDYPEIYLLHNGYKEFFETHIEHCTPHAYRPMLEPSYNEEYRHFRAKSKSWNGDGLGGATQRIKKSRSRLMV